MVSRPQEKRKEMEKELTMSCPGNNKNGENVAQFGIQISIRPATNRKTSAVKFGLLLGNKLLT